MDKQNADYSAIKKKQTLDYNNLDKSFFEKASHKSTYAL